MEKLKEIKKFRNEIDDNLVFNHATKERKDFTEFKKEILSFLRQST
jgi:hypothetical protein